MKTFDIALKYLKDIDYKIGNIVRLKGADITESEEDKIIVAQITERHEQFSIDKRNTEGSEYYRGVVFTAAIYHLIAKAKGFVSFFDVACEIVESEIGIVKTDYERYKDTDYPKAMVEKWDMYCEEISDQEHSAFVEGALRLDLFFAAYHYLVGQKVTETV